MIDFTLMVLENHVQEFKITWYFVPGFQDAYAVGSDGSVWSRYVGIGMHSYIGGMSDWRKLAPVPDKKGYLHGYFSFGGKKTVFIVHQLVATLFIGPCPSGLQVCHNDGNPANNHLCNLRYDTQTSNQHDRFKHGTHSRGEHNGNAFLTQGLVDLIREEYATGRYTYRQLGGMYGVHHGTIGRIITNKKWVPIDLTTI
jgi:HNH endonuclease